MAIEQDQLPALVEPVRAIAQRAADKVMAIYARGFDVVLKSDNTPLTDADLAAHDCIEQGLNAIDSDVPVLSEEGGEALLSERHQWSQLWLVDPLDGTREFVRRSDQFSINIALIQDHTAVFGLIWIPVSGDCYYAYAGGGAFKQPLGAPPQPIHTRRLGHQPVQVAGGRTYTGRPLATYLEYMGRHRYMAVGSSLKSCLVAEGRVDLYPRFGPTSEWDTAAAQVIVEQAGGGVTDMYMRPLRYNARPTLINPDFFVFGDRSRDWSQYLPRRKPRVEIG